MSDFITKKCDNCGKMKLENNGWFSLRTNDEPFFLLISKHNDSPMVLADMMRNKRKQTVKLEVLDLCGQTCVLEKVSKLLGEY